VHALILAAGFGTRLGPLGEQVPKALLPIGSRRAIDFVLAAAEAVPQIRRVDVVGNQRFHAQLAAWAATSGATRPLRVWNDGAAAPKSAGGRSETSPDG